MEPVPKWIVDKFGFMLPDGSRFLRSRQAITHNRMRPGQLSTTPNGFVEISAFYDKAHLNRRPIVQTFEGDMTEEEHMDWVWDFLQKLEMGTGKNVISVNTEAEMFGRGLEYDCEVVVLSGYFDIGVVGRVGRIISRFPRTQEGKVVWDVSIARGKGATPASSVLTRSVPEIHLIRTYPLP